MNKQQTNKKKKKQGEKMREPFFVIGIHQGVDPSFLFGCNGGVVLRVHN
jgi:hypothetical protein